MKRIHSKIKLPPSSDEARRSLGIIKSQRKDPIRSVGRLPSAADNFNVGYGMTECGGLATMATGDMLLEHPDCVGRALPNAEVAIFDAADLQVAAGVDGNICIRGAMVMPGYWGNPEASADALRPGGWLKTGDIGQLRDGLLFLASRKRDMIIRGGENIYPREIEEFLYTHPDIEDAQLIGVPSSTYGEEVMAWVKPKAGASLTDDQLTAFCKGTVATYKIPRYWKQVEEFPMTVTGKVQKFRMREIAIEELARGRAVGIETA